MKRVHALSGGLRTAITKSPVALLIFQLFLGGMNTASAQEPTGFLLRQRVRLIVSADGLDATTERVIFRDGLIVTTTLTLTDVQISRRRASPAALRQLHEAFRQHQIGHQRGECFAAFTQFDFFQETYTWFARGPAGHTFKVGDPFVTPCDQNLVGFLSDVSAFLDSATPEPGLQDVVVPN